MANPFPPSTIRAWQYSDTKGGIEKHLKINASAPLPKPKSNQSLVQIIATALNPVDYKGAEVGGRLLVSKNATPGIDFVGRIVTPAAGTAFKPGDVVFGCAGTSPFAGGALSEFAVAGIEATAPVPEGVDPIDAGTIGIAGLTAYQTIVPHVKKGDKIFINGGSGGTGVFGIQIAKAVGCHVTTTCSTANVEFCKSLGADEVVDYRKQNVLEALKASGNFEHVVDNVGADLELYWKGHEFMTPGAIYVKVGGSVSVGTLVDVLKVKLWPAFLGGPQRQYSGFFTKHVAKDLSQIATWMKEGEVKAIIDRKFLFEEAPQAFEKLKLGRARGKIVIEVASKTGA